MSNRFRNNALIYHSVHGLGHIKSSSIDKSRFVAFDKEDPTNQISIPENQLKIIQNDEGSLLQYKNELCEVDKVFVENSQVKYKISYVDVTHLPHVVINNDDYNISNISKDENDKLKKISEFVKKYNKTIKYLNCKRKTGEKVKVFKEQNVNSIRVITKKCFISIKSLINLPMYLKKTYDHSLEIGNIERNPFDFIRPDFQIITYEKAINICELNNLVIPFEIKCEKWSYDLMHKYKTFYIDASRFYDYFKEFCALNKMNYEKYRDCANEIIIHKKINNRGYKTTKYLYETEKQMTDTCMSLFYDKKYNVDKNIILQFIEEFELNNVDGINFKLGCEQKIAVVNAITNKLYIINGFPGTGKSTIVECILYIFQKLRILYGDVDDDVDVDVDGSTCDLNTELDLDSEFSDEECDDSDNDENKIAFEKKCKYPNSQNISILAPTGLAYIGLKNKCANKSVTEINKKYNFNPTISGTCHRVTYLQYPKIKAIIEKYEKDPDIDLVGVFPELLIIDEFSMIDSFLFKEILEWCDYFKCRLIILGDENQLPSIGPGCNLKNILESKLFDTVKLNDIRRQKNGLLMENIKKMTTQKLTRSDFADSTTQLLDVDRFIGDDGELNKLQLTLFIEEKEFNKNNSKFLTYFKDPKFAFNRNILNNTIQNIFNKNGKKIPNKYDKYVDDIKFRVGDIIIRTENDYSEPNDVRANGEQAEISSYDNNNNIVIKYLEDGKEYTVSNKTLYEEFTLAYSLTVHSSQGSQYDYVVVFIDKNNKIWDKNAFYTAVSRAKKGCIVISNDGDIHYIQNNLKNINDKISLFMKESDIYEFE